MLGLSLRLVARRTGPREHDLASVMYLAAGLGFRFAWVYAGRASATDDAAVAAMARRPARAGTLAGVAAARLSPERSPLPLPDPTGGHTAKPSGAPASQSSGGSAHQAPPTSQPRRGVPAG